MIANEVTNEIKDFFLEKKLTTKEEYTAFAENNATEVDEFMIALADKHKLWATDDGEQESDDEDEDAEDGEEGDESEG